MQLLLQFFFFCCVVIDCLHADVSVALRLRSEMCLSLIERGFTVSARYTQLREPTWVV